nr:MAG TPA: hypothetical protein [Caudoviricetes sp.]
MRCLSAYRYTFSMDESYLHRFQYKVVVYRSDILHHVALSYH